MDGEAHGDQRAAIVGIPCSDGATVLIHDSLHDRQSQPRSPSAAREEGLKIARESLLEVRDEIQGVQVSAPFGNVKYALEVFQALPEFSHG